MSTLAILTRVQRRKVDPIVLAEIRSVPLADPGPRPNTGLAPLTGSAVTSGQPRPGFLIVLLRALSAWHT